MGGCEKTREARGYQWQRIRQPNALRNLYERDNINRRDKALLQMGVGMRPLKTRRYGATLGNNWNPRVKQGLSFLAGNNKQLKMERKGRGDPPCKKRVWERPVRIGIKVVRVLARRLS